MRSGQLNFISDFKSTPPNEAIRLRLQIIIQIENSYEKKNMDNKMNPMEMMKKITFNRKQVMDNVDSDDMKHKCRIVFCGGAMAAIALGMMSFHTNVVYRAW